MDPWFALAALGALLVLVGLLAVFKVRGSGDNVLKLPVGVEIKSATTGGFLAAMGVILCLVGVQQGTRTETRVTSVRLATNTGQDSAQYYVRCPINVPMAGSISVSGDPGTVSYRLDRQDGFNGPITQGRVEALAFEEAGTQSVSFNVPITFPEGEVYFENRLVVIDPTNLQSEPVRISVRCNPYLPPGPPSPPPNVSPPS